MTPPVVLFTHARPDLLRRTLQCLRENRVPLVYAFSDGPATPAATEDVEHTRRLLHAIDWCDVVSREREHNLGLGRSILTGVSEVLASHESIIVFEDDLVCVPGTYHYLTAALHHYRDVRRVMSVTGWNHPSVTPRNVVDQPYFDGRAECWVWGTWARAWQGMVDEHARTLMRMCTAQGIDVYRYGADLPEQARVELKKNTWAVRFLYWHILKRGLCLRPPWSMVEHVGFDSRATNASAADGWANPPLKECPPIPCMWPEPVEHTDCAALWQKAYGPRHSVISSSITSVSRRAKQAVRTAAVQLTGNETFKTMTARELVKQVVPPLVVDVGRHLTRKRSSSARPAWEYVPEGWSYVQTHPDVRGWNVGEVLDVYKQKWPAFLSMVEAKGPLGVSHESLRATNEDIGSHNTMMAFAYALTRAAHKRDRLSMLDWGGGIGHYYLLATSLLPDVEIEYACRDLSMLSEHGATLFPDQQFYSDDRCFDRVYDFVLASSSMHYVEDWRTLLRRLAASTGGYLYVTRLPTVQSGSSYVFLQRPYAYGYNTEYLGWALSRGEFLDEAIGAGVDLVREFVIAETPAITNAPEPCQYRGFLFRAAERG